MLLLPLILHFKWQDCSRCKLLSYNRAKQTGGRSSKRGEPVVQRSSGNSGGFLVHLLGEQLILAFLLGPVCGFIYCVWNCGIISHKLVWKCDQPHDFLHALLPAFWQMLLARPKANVPANFMFNNTNCEAALLLVDLWCLCLRPNGDG